MKKKALIIAICAAAVLLAAVLCYTVGTGFAVRTDVAMLDYSVSEDGKTLTFRVFVASSAGCTRGFFEQTDGTARRLTFYAAFGGLNGRIGAKNEFTLVLNETDTEISFNSPDGFTVVLKKVDGVWQRPTDGLSGMITEATKCGVLCRGEATEPYIVQ